MTRLALKTLLRGAGDDLVREVVSAWLGKDAAPGRGKTVRGKTALVARLATEMEDEAGVVKRLEGLPRRLAELLESFLLAGTALSVPGLFAELSRNFKSRFDLEACLAALQREGWLLPATDRSWSNYDGPGYAVPSELARCVLQHRQRTRSALGDVLTMRGFLDARYFRNRAAGNQAKGNRERQGDGPTTKDRSEDHARKIYKIYALDASIAQRRSKLPRSVARVFELSLLRHGGLSSWKDLGQELDADELPDLESCRRSLEEGMLGTAGRLDLARFGLQPLEPGLVVFHEVALAELRRAKRGACGGQPFVVVGKARG